MLEGERLSRCARLEPGTAPGVAQHRHPAGSSMRGITVGRGGTDLVLTIMRLCRRVSLWHIAVCGR